jgi:hypothetical protein
LLPLDPLEIGGRFSRSSLWPMNFGNWWGCFGLPGGLVMSCNAVRDVRTFCWISVVDIGVKNFLKRLGVMVGGLIGFLELLVLAGRAGEDTGASRSVSDMAVEFLSTAQQSCLT